jgi:hypothetical protein
VADVKWDGDNDVYHSSFQRDGKQMPVIRGKDGQLRERRSAMKRPIFLWKFKIHLKAKPLVVFKIKVGDNTYFSAQINGQDMYFVSKGKPIKMLNRPKNKLP